MQRFVDISMAIENGVPSDPPDYEFDVRYIGHAETVPMLQGRYVGLRAADMIGGEAFALEAVHRTYDRKRSHPKSAPRPLQAGAVHI